MWRIDSTIYVPEFNASVVACKKCSKSVACVTHACIMKPTILNKSMCDRGFKDYSSCCGSFCNLSPFLTHSFDHLISFLIDTQLCHFESLLSCTQWIIVASYEPSFHVMSVYVYMISSTCCFSFFDELLPARAYALSYSQSCYYGSHNHHELCVSRHLCWICEGQTLNTTT